MERIGLDGVTGWVRLECMQTASENKQHDWHAYGRGVKGGSDFNPAMRESGHSKSCLLLIGIHGLHDDGRACANVIFATLVHIARSACALIRPTGWLVKDYMACLTTGISLWDCLAGKPKEK